MGNLGFGEIIMIVVFALVVIGPNRLPQAGRQLGKALAEFRRVSSGVRQDLEEALDVSELKDTVNEFRNVMDPRKLLADTISPLSDTDKPVSGVMVDHSASGRPGVISSAAVPPPDADMAAEHSGISAGSPWTVPGVSVPAPSSAPGRDILDDPDAVL